jgi:hypothetical protein
MRRSAVDPRRARLVSRALALACASLLPAGCGGGGGGPNPPPGPTTLTVSGLIAVGGAPLAGVTVDLTGDATASMDTAADGLYSFPGLAPGSYTVTPSRAGYTFDPPSRTPSTDGGLTFDHQETGNATLGTVTIVSVLWGGLNAFPSFEAPNPPDGVGFVRARSAAELAPPDVPQHHSMWAAGGPVTLTYSHALGTDTIVLVLGAFPALSASSSAFHLVGTVEADVLDADFEAIP